MGQIFVLSKIHTDSFLDGLGLRASPPEAIDPIPPETMCRTEKRYTVNWCNIMRGHSTRLAAVNQFPQLCTNTHDLAEGPHPEDYYAPQIKI